MPPLWRRRPPPSCAKLAVVAGGEPKARNRQRERAAWLGFQAHARLGPRFAKQVSQAANRIIDAQSVAAVLAARWPQGTTTDPAILRAEIRMILVQHARFGVLGPALEACYRAGWKAGEIAADDAVARVKPSVPPALGVPLHHRPTPEFR